jgi:hypothetical protein
MLVSEDVRTTGSDKDTPYCLDSENWESHYPKSSVQLMREPSHPIANLEKTTSEAQRMQTVSTVKQLCRDTLTSKSNRSEFGVPTVKLSKKERKRHKILGCC